MHIPPQSPPPMRGTAAIQRPSTARKYGDGFGGARTHMCAWMYGYVHAAFCVLWCVCVRVGMSVSLVACVNDPPPSALLTRTQSTAQGANWRNLAALTLAVSLVSLTMMTHPSVCTLMHAHQQLNHAPPPPLPGSTPRVVHHQQAPWPTRFCRPQGSNTNSPRWSSPAIDVSSSRRPWDRRTARGTHSSTSAPAK